LPATLTTRRKRPQAAIRAGAARVAAKGPRGSIAGPVAEETAC